MLTAIFGKKKVSGEILSNIFVNVVLEAVERTYPILVEAIQTDPEFITSPQLKQNDTDRLEVIVLTANLSYLSRYFTSTEEELLRRDIITTFAKVYDMSYSSMKEIIDDYESFMYRINHPSKNMVYAMSKAMFHKYHLNPYQEHYFANMNTPNPLFLQRLNKIMENFIWDWSTFFDKYKLAL